jgi:hypothetical protein
MQHARRVGRVGVRRRTTTNRGGRGGWAHRRREFGSEYQMIRWARGLALLMIESQDPNRIVDKLSWTLPLAGGSESNCSIFCLPNS